MVRKGVELAGVVDKRTGRPLSVVDGKQINNKWAGQKFASSGVAQAMTASELLPPAAVEWTPSTGVELVTGAADGGATFVGAASDSKEFNYTLKKSFPVRDDVARLLTKQEEDYYDESVCGSRRRRLPERQAAPSALFGGGSSVMDSLAGYQDKPSDSANLGGAAGTHVAGGHAVGKKTYDNYSAYGHKDNNTHIAVGDRVNDFGQMTTQELLWGNMIRRAR